MGLFDSIKNEAQQRINEAKESKDYIRSEEERLREKRENAKKNIFRKIKPIDAISSKVEEKRDENTIAKLEQEEAERLAEERSERTRKIAFDNRKTLAIIAAVIILVFAGFISINRLIENSKAEDQYNEAVKLIINEDYQSAVNSLKEIEDSGKYDSLALLDYANLQNNIGSFKERPGEFLSALTNINSIENEDIKIQYEFAVEQSHIAEEISNEINKLDLTSLNADSSKIIETIGEKSSQLSDRYSSLISFDNYEKAKAIVDAIENNTNAGKLYLQINSIADIDLNSGEFLDSLISSYDDLSDSDKELVQNHSVLVNAENKYKKLVEEEEKRIAEEKAKEEEERRIAEEKAKEEERLKAEKEQREQSWLDESVIVPIGGTCYHIDGCPSLRNPSNWRVITRRQAIDEGYPPCSKCDAGYKGF